MIISKKRLYILLAPLVLLLVLGAVSYGLFSGGSTSVFKVNTAASVVDRISAAEKKGGTVELTDADFNALLELAVKKEPMSGEMKIDGIYSHIADGKLQLFMPVSYSGLKLHILTSGDLSYSEGQVIFKPDYMKVGRIKLPIQFIVKHFNLSSLNEAEIKDDGSMVIPKEVLPFNIKSLSINGDKIVLVLDKTSASQQTAQQNSSNKSGTSNSRTELLKRGQSQLSGVYSSVKTPAEKAVIGQIQTVVGKMISDPSYSYGAEAQQVKTQYGKLSAEEQSDIKDVILMNMDTGTLREIKNTFGL